MKPFVHLHVHTEYSLLDGAIRCKDLAKRVASWGSPAVAMTDHGVMFGAVEFYQACCDQGVKPIIGCEIYVAPDGIAAQKKERNHLILLAKNQVGYHNLVKLVSIANTKGMYYKPRIDHDLLAQYHEGLVVSSACLAGEISRFLLEGDEKKALERAKMYQDILGKENYYLEIMPNQLKDQLRVNRMLIEMARKHDFPLIATNDAHYLDPEDYDWHEILLCVGTGKQMSDPTRMSFETNDFYLRSPDEMWSIFGDEVPEALTNTVKIAEMCDFKYSLKSGKYQLPKFEVPQGETLDSYLEKSAFQGLKDRFNGQIPSAEYDERMKYELQIIRQMGFSGYFLIIADVIQACKNQGIPIGPGRGSAVGSLVAYALRITELDPLRFNLLFERFLNPERISMPDIDTDVSDKGREDLIRYVVDKYGVENVSQIITFGRMKTKAAIKDVGRALGLPYAEVNHIAKLVPDGVNSIQEALEQSEELSLAKEESPQIAEMLDSAAKMEGLARHASQHAAGVVITPVPLTDLVPVKRIGEDQVVTQFSMEPVENLGLVKMDFLGLQTLSILQQAIENIRLSGKGDVDLSTLPLDDHETFKLLAKADTLGVFQLESPGMRRLIRRMVPDRFEDLVAILALYRPGPLESGMVDQYVNCKHGEKPSYLHPKLEPILKETYGVILYQEQVMQCASILAGYSLGGADLLRRAMGKKKVEVMNEQRSIFVEGAVKNGIERSAAEHVFDIIQKFAGYGFNKSHTAAYAMISYQTAYLKAHYRTEFMAAYLSSKIGAKQDVMADYIRQVKASGVPVLAPDINASRQDFTAHDQVIRFGLGAVKGMGDSAISVILKSRDEKGPFVDFWDFCCRVCCHQIGKSTVENLIKAGAFDSMGVHRNRLLSVCDDFVTYATKLNSRSLQPSLFGDMDVIERPDMPEQEEMSFDDLLLNEKEVLGMYISGHPLDKFKVDFNHCMNASLEDIPYWQSEKCGVQFLGMLTDIRELITKKGDSMGILSFDDGDYQVQVVCFPKGRDSMTWLETKALLIKGAPYLVQGQLDRSRGDEQVIMTRIYPKDQLSAVPHYTELTMSVNVFEHLSPATLLRSFEQVQGMTNLILKVVDGDDKIGLLLPQEIKVDPKKLPQTMESLGISSELFQVSGRS